jgi:TolB protein
MTGAPGLEAATSGVTVLVSVGDGWSPDGTKIAFVSRRVPPNRVYLMNAAGSDQHPVLPSGGPQFVLVWQPRGDGLDD